MQPRDRDYITIVSGLPRSGTSLMMQMLAAGGLPPLTDDLRQPDENNPRGYFEFESVKRLRTDQSWLGHARGRAVKIIHLLVRELPTDGRFKYRVILMKRPMEEVLASQRAMLERQGKRAGDDAILTKVYKSQLEQTERWLASESAFKVFCAAYHAVLKTPEQMANQINTFLGGGLDITAIVGAVDPLLHRQRSTAL